MSRPNHPSPTIGLALSGGGARGLAHVGVLKVLEQARIPIHHLSGTSMGGVIAAAYAAGLSPTEIEAEALHLSSRRQLISLLDRARPRRGLLQGTQVMAFLARHIGDRTFAQLGLPLTLVAVDLNRGQKVYMNEGRILEAIRATIAVPGLLSPVERGDQILVDGGLLDNLPVDAARQAGCDLVIGVDVATSPDAIAATAQALCQRPLMPEGLVEILDVLWRSLAILVQEANRRSLESGRPDLIIRPAIPSGVTILTGLTRAGETILSGEDAAHAALPRLLSLIEGTSL